jgi:FtsZ-binding cell division protein ZapB
MDSLNTDKNQITRMKRNNIIVIVLSVILLVVVVLLFVQKSEHRIILSEINAEKDSIQVELKQIAASYDSLRTENDTINEQLILAQAKVKDLLIEVEQTKKISLQKITEYQNSVNTLRGIMRDFYVQIDSLNRKNELLMAENLEVKDQVKRVETENVQLSQEKDRLQQNLQRAAMLEARELYAEGLNNRDRETRFANRTEKIRIYFVLGKNVSARRGAKNIYARIMRPDQLLLTKSTNDLFQFEDVRIPYSAVREVNYEGLDLPVAIFWDNTNEPELKPGIYTVNLFADGNIIGELKFELR